MYFGVGEITDAFIAGLTLPQILVAVLSGSLGHVLVHLLSGEEEKKRHQDSWIFFYLIAGFFSLLAGSLIFSAEYWVSLIVPGFSASAQNLTIQLAKIQLIGMVFNAVNTVQLASYHANQQFLWTEIAPLITSMLGFALLVWGLPKYGIFAGAWISILRFALQTVLLLPGMGRPVYPDLHNHTVRTAWKKIKPLLFGSLYFKSGKVVDRILLSAASQGSLSLFYFANQVFEAVGYIFNKALVAPLGPALSIGYKTGNMKIFKQVYYRKIIQTLLLGMLGFCFLFVFGRDILTLVLGYGNINAENFEFLWRIMLWLSGLIIGGSGITIVNKAFYSLGNTTVPTKLNIITYTVFIPAKIWFFFNFGIIGLAFSITAYSLLTFLILMLLFENYFHRFDV